MLRHVITWIKEHGRWVALALLILVNIVLLILLLVRQASYSAVPAPGPPTWSGTVSRPTPVASATPSTVPTPTLDQPSPSAAPAESGPARLMAANSGRIAWRAEEGTCSKRATVEVTTDGGRTWHKTDPGIRGIVRLRAYGDKSVFAVGADKDCKPTYAWTTSPSGEWRRDPSIMYDVWFRYPSDKSGCTLPAAVGSGRAAATLWSRSPRSAATGQRPCVSDGRIRTIAGGRGWRTVEATSGAVAINADDSTFVAARVMKDCDGVVLQTFAASGKGLDDDARPCRSMAVDESDRVGVAVQGSAEWAWAAAQSFEN